MSLAKYVYSKPDRPQAEWCVTLCFFSLLRPLTLVRRVRATFITNSQKLNPAFLVPADTQNVPAPPTNDLQSRPKIINVTSDDFVPSLTEHHLQRIDALLERSKSWGTPPTAIRNAVKMAPGESLKLNKDTRMYMAGLEKTQRECANCHEVDPKMQMCGRCKVVSRFVSDNT